MNQGLLRILELAYDTPLNQERWPHVLDAMVEELHGNAAALLMRETSGPVYQINELSQRYRQVLSEDGNHYMRELAKYEADDWNLVAQLSPDEILHDDKMGIPVEVLDTRPDYQYLRERAGIGRRIGFRLNHNRGFFDAITLAFPAELNQVSEHAVQGAKFLIPHLARALELTRSFGLLRQKYTAVLGAIDHLKIGLAISLPTGELLIENAEARRIFDARDSLWLTSQRRLLANNEDDTKYISRAISEAASTAAGVDAFLGGMVHVAKRSGGSPVAVDISPIGASRDVLASDLQGAVLTMIDPDALPEFDFPRFATLYRLGQAEAEVCSLLTFGDTAATIGEKRNTSVNTARNQIANVLEKTGCANRSQLIRLIARTIPPII